MANLKQAYKMEQEKEAFVTETLRGLKNMAYDAYGSNYEGFELGQADMDKIVSGKIISSSFEGF